MYKPIFNKRRALKFTRFTNHGYSLFAVLGKEVIIGVLSVATLQHATAKGISVEEDKVTSDTAVANRNVLLEEVSVTGTRAPLTVSQQARMVTVLSREDILAAPVQSVNDLLKYATGVDVRQKGPMGALTDVSIRGGNSEQITVLLNGIPVGDAQTGHNAFDFPVDISEIERIEVLEGPAGRVYGTSSLLGAINIVTKTPSSTSLSAHAEAGSYGYLGAGVRGNLALGRWNNQLSASCLRSDGYLRNKTGRLSADYRAAKAFYQGNYHDALVAVGWHAGVSLKDFGSNTFYGAKYDDQFEHTLKTFTAITAENLQGAFRFRPSVYWNRSMDRFELFRDAPGKYPFNYHRTDVYGLNLNAYFDWLLGRTALGAELRNEDLVSTNLGNPLARVRPVHKTGRSYEKGLNRTNIQLMAEHNVILDRFTLSAGLVAVKNTQADMNMRVYPGVDFSYRVGRDWKIYASYNSSLRMPSITELFYSVGGHKANPHLKPEELSAWEAGVRYASAAVTGKASIFYNRHKNLIDWISDGTTDEKGAPLWQSVNYGKIRTLGVEASLDFNLRRMFPSQRLFKRFEIAYTYLNQHENEHAGIVSKYALEYLKNKLASHLSLNVWRKLVLDARYRFQHRMGTYLDTDNAVRKYAGYGVLDARLSWSEATWNVYVEGNNVLGKNYVDYGNVVQPGAWIVAGVAVSL